MWAILSLSIAIAVMTALQLMIISKKGTKRERYAFIILMTLSSSLALAYTAKLPVFNPVIWLNRVFLPAGEWINKLLS
ncbi:hypothetical protein [Paenibacillus sp. GCM10027626]|uniref:hypothetical protein n=1 Tax=Paenibacillus sp. GCM10027626 TaxID=3273411 RepID=UPI00363FBEEB